MASKKEVRQKLAQFIIDNIPMNTAFEEAGVTWPEKWLKQSLDGGKKEFRRLCLVDALTQNDSKLFGEAMKYGYKPETEDLMALSLGKEMTGLKASFEK